MNERIKELQGQTLDKYFSHTWTNMDYVDLSKFAEKFAELIVRECAEICRRQQYYDADDEHKRGVNGGSITCMNAIKREFGVEL